MSNNMGYISAFGSNVNYNLNNVFYGMITANSGRDSCVVLESLKNMLVIINLI